MLTRKLKFALAIGLATALSLGATGCEFFGKKGEEALKAPGLLATGAYVVGSWTISTMPTSATNTPTFAVTSTYTFDPTGVARVTAQENRAGGVTCIGYGQYRVLGASDVIVYVQATNLAMCGFPAQIHLSEIQIFAQHMTFKDPGSNETFVYFKDNVQAAAPVGVWQFNGAGGVGGENGIDFLLLDPNGYFIMQSTEAGQHYLLLGSYVIAQGGLRMNFFSSMDPTSTAGYWQFNQFVTDGQILQLVESLPDGDVVYTGSRL